MRKFFISLFSSLPLGFVWAQTTQAASPTTERDFLDEVPIVLSVSRLAQRIDEAPGAVTILDRQMIEKSGARDLVDLLRLVPGFQTNTSFETDAPLAAYHGISDDWANRIQVLVDGRSVYSTHLYGSTGLGMQTLALTEIERVEILRGSNSAAYGSRAFLGVINIISRDVREAQGMEVSVTAGDRRIADGSASVSWSGEDSHHRINASTRSDAGLRGAYGANRLSRMNLSNNFALGGGNELDVRFGLLGIEAGRGSLVPGEYGNPARMRSLGTGYLQADWRKVLSDSQDVLLSASHTENRFQDAFVYLNPESAMADYFGTTIDFNGHEYNDALTLQYTERHSPVLRTVSGVELRNEKLVAPSSFSDRKQYETAFTRLFTNIEWRAYPSLVVNGGLMAEQSTISGDSISPRLMANWHAGDGQTLRAGFSTAFRPPSPYEKYAYVRYYDKNGANPLTFVQHTGNVKPERVHVRELGYNFNLARVNVSGDVRVYEETVMDGIRGVGNPLNGWVEDSYNGDNFRISGLEWQTHWKSPGGTRLMFTQAWTKIDLQSSIDPDMDFRLKNAVARYTGSLAWIQPLSQGWEFSLLYSSVNDIALMSISRRPWVFNLERADVRLAKNMRFGKSNAELALTVQNIGGPINDADWQYWMDPRAMITLRITH